MENQHCRRRALPAAPLGEPANRHYWIGISKTTKTGESAKLVPKSGSKTIKIMLKWVPKSIRNRWKIEVAPQKRPRSALGGILVWKGEGGDILDLILAHIVCEHRKMHQKMHPKTKPKMHGKSMPEGPPKNVKMRSQTTKVKLIM